MGKNSRRKTSKASKKNRNQDYDLSTLDQALIAINEGNMSVRKASEVFEIPKSTLSDAKFAKDLRIILVGNLYLEKYLKIF